MTTALQDMVSSQPQTPPREKRPSGANILGVLAHHPALARAWFTLNGHMLRGSALTDRHRELVMLRVAAVWKSTYQWAQHLPMGRDAGLTDLEIAEVAWGASSPHWDDAEAAFVRAADELIERGVISDDTWTVLRDELTDEQILDLIVTVGTFSTTAWIVRSLEIELDDDLLEYAAAMIKHG